MTHWFFSPHADDAALSCGGQIATRTGAGEACVIVTVMAGDPPSNLTITPFIEELWTRWQLGRGAAATQARREEDQMAAEALGAQIKFLEYPDAIYRSYYPDVKAIFGAPAFPDMIGLFNALTNDLSQKLEIRAGDTAHLPLGIGGHVDHLIVGSLGAALKKLESVVYYEDYPYSRDRSLIDSTLAQRFKGNNQPMPILYPLDNSALNAKIKAVACYRSQLSSFWPDETAMAAGIRDYTREVAGEREWTLTSAESK